jgi:hypothetical protein
MIRVITLSNKPDLLLDAIESVKNQKRFGDVVHIIGRDDGIYQSNIYKPAVFFYNEIQRSDDNDYICWLSDDDVMQPNYTKALGDYLDEHPEIMACYGSAKCILYDPPKFNKEIGRHLADRVFSKDSGESPCCAIDGSQVLARAKAYKDIVFPITEESCRISDGIIMQKIASLYPIVPVPTPDFLMLLRTTPQSAHTAAGKNGELIQVDHKRNRE